MSTKETKNNETAAVGKGCDGQNNATDTAEKKADESEKQDNIPSATDECDNIGKAIINKEIGILGQISVDLQEVNRWDESSLEEYVQKLSLIMNPGARVQRIHANQKIINAMKTESLKELNGMSRVHVFFALFLLCMYSNSVHSDMPFYVKFGSTIYTFLSFAVWLFPFFFVASLGWFFLCFNMLF